MEAKRLLLAGLAVGGQLGDMAAAARVLHPRDNTFPGEVFMELAADALEEASVARDHPLDYAAVRASIGEDLELRGRENEKIQYALLVTASAYGGVRPDLLAELEWWRTDDFWDYALAAAVGYFRAAAEHAGVTVAELATRVAARHNVAVGAPS